MKIEVLEILDEMVPKINEKLAINTGSDFFDSIKSSLIEEIAAWLENHHSESYKSFQIFTKKPQDEAEQGTLSCFWLKLNYTNSCYVFSTRYYMYKYK